MAHSTRSTNTSVEDGASFLIDQNTDSLYTLHSFHRDVYISLGLIPCLPEFPILFAHSIPDTHKICPAPDDEVTSQATRPETLADFPEFLQVHVTIAKEAFAATKCMQGWHEPLQALNR